MGVARRPAGEIPAAAEWAVAGRVLEGEVAARAGEVPAAVV